MPFTPKNWEDFPTTTTPLSAAALEDAEDRVTDYTDAAVTAAIAGIPSDGPIGTPSLRSLGTGATQAAAGADARLTHFINAKAPPYNAKGDNTTDDTAALQAAIDAGEAEVTSNRRGAIVYIPAGSYRTSAPLTVEQDGITILGAGRGKGNDSTSPAQPNNAKRSGTQIIPLSTFSGLAAIIVANSTYVPTNVWIKDLGVHGEFIPTATLVDGIRFASFRGGIENIWIRMMTRDGLRLTQGPSPSVGFPYQNSDNRFFNVETEFTNRYGIHIEDSSGDSEFVVCSVNKAGLWPDYVPNASAHGWFFAANAVGSMLLGCYIHGCEGKAVFSNNTYQLKFLNCRIQDTNGGIYLTSSAASLGGFLINGCTFRNNSWGPGQVKTTLSAAIVSTSATTLNVSSAVGPSSGNYDILIDSEYMTVTGGQGTTTWTVTRGARSSTAATHLNGATVFQVDRDPTGTADNTLDAININPTGGTSSGGMINGCDFSTDTGASNGGPAGARNRIRYGINVAHANARNVVIGPYAATVSDATSTFGTGPINRAGTATQTVSYTLAQSAVASSLTGTTSESTLATVTVAGGTMGLHGRLRITGLMRRNASGTDDATMRVRFGGTGGSTYYLKTVTTASLTTAFSVVIANRGSASSQVGTPNALDGGYGTVNGSPSTSAINTAADTTLVFRGQLVNAADTITLESYQVELIP